MGEAKRRKETGNTGPNPNWKKKKKMTKRDIQNLSDDILSDMMFSYKDGISKIGR